MDKHNKESAGNTFKDYKQRRQKKYYNKKHSSNNDYVVGIHPVEEALAGGRTINKLLVAKGKHSRAIHEIIVVAKQHKLVIQEVDESAISRLAGSSAHQGIAAYMSPYDYYDLETELSKMGEDTLVLALDNLTDVHNFGSILRTCEATAVDYVLIPDRRSVQVNATVAKTSAGAVEHVKIIRTHSLGNAIIRLKEAGFWVTGADAKGVIAYDKASYSGRHIIVSGAEGDGLRPHIKRICDHLVYIPMAGVVNSLNVSVATSLLLYQWRGQRDVSH